MYIYSGILHSVGHLNYLVGQKNTSQTHLKIRQRPESREEGHGFTRARWATQHHGFVLGQPGVEEGLMSHCVYCGDHHIRGSNLVSLHLDLEEETWMMY